MDEKKDVLNRDEFVNKLKTLVEMLADKKQGCCFGIDGAWGSGKTFVLNMLEKELKNIQLEETTDNKYYVFITIAGNMIIMMNRLLRLFQPCWKRLIMS